MADYKKYDRLRWKRIDYRVLGEEPGEHGSNYVLQMVDEPQAISRVPIENLDTLGDLVQAILLKMNSGSKLTHPQAGFWLLDGKEVDDTGPLELQDRELIPLLPLGTSIQLTGKGRAIAKRLGESCCRSI